MSRKSDSAYSLVQITRVFSSDFLTQVVNTVLGFRGKASQTARLRLETACRKTFRIKGFSDPSRVPNRLLVNPIVETLGYSETIVSSVLAVWLESRADLAQAVAEYLTSHQQPIPEWENLRYGFPGAWLDNVMRTVAEDFRAQHPTCSEDEAALMLCCVLGWAPLLSEHLDEKDVDVVKDAAVILNPVPIREVQGVMAEPPVEQSIMTQPESVIVTPSVSTSSSTSILPDVEAALKHLDRSLQAAHELLSLGDFADLIRWGNEFAQDAARAQDVWAGTLSDLHEHAKMIEQQALQHLAPHDRPVILEPLLNHLQQCTVASRLKETQNVLNQLTSSIEEYRQRRLDAKRNVQDSITAVAQALVVARSWDLADADWQARVISPDEVTAALRELERGASLNRELEREIQRTIQQGRSELTAELLNACDDLLSRLTDPADTEEVLSVKAGLIEDLDDFELRACRTQIVAIREKLAHTPVLPDVAELAADYLREPDQTYLELLIDALAQHNQQVEVFVLLSTAIRSPEWRPGTQINSAVLNAYFGGLLEVTSAVNALSTALDALANGLFAAQIHLQEPAARFKLSVFYASALAVRSGCLMANDLWSFQTDEFTTQAPQLTSLIKRVMEGDAPVIRRREDVPEDELRRVMAWLEDDLKREGGRFVRSRGRNSIVMTNMEQQYLLPGLEAKWKSLRQSQPGRKDWEEARHWLKETEASQVFKDYCEKAGVTTDSSPFYQPAFEERVQHVLEHFERYMALRERIAEIQTKQPVSLDDALLELSQISSITREPLTSLARLALAEVAEEQPPADHTDSRLSPEQRFVADIRNTLLHHRTIWINLPTAVAWLGRAVLSEGENWNKLVTEIIESLAHPIGANDLLDYYLVHHMPEIAQLLVPVGQPEVASRVDALRTQLREDLFIRLAELKKRRLSLLPQEERWRDDGRWKLLLSRLDERLENLRTEEARQEQASKEVLRETVQAANALDDRIMQADYLPPATSGELYDALDAVRDVSRRSQTQCLDAARLVLQEITHMLDYRSSNAEGTHRAFEELLSLRAGKGRLIPAEIVENTSLDSAISTLEKGDYESLGLRPSVYSDAGWDDRQQLLKIWRRAKSFPADSAQMTPDQFDDLRHLALSFAKIVWMEYSQSARSADHPTHYFLREPVVHFESVFRQPRTSALRTNVLLVFLTEQQPSLRRLRELDAIIDDQRWLRDGFFVVIMTLGESAIVHDWARRRYAGQTLVVLDDSALSQIVLSGDNPTSVGRFSYLLLHAAGPRMAEVFRYQNLVDKKHDVFVGRDDWINRLARSEQSYAIYGGRRIGKSSLLRAVMNDLQATGAKAIYKSFEGPDAQNGGLSVAQHIIRSLGIAAPCDSFISFKQLLGEHFTLHPEAKIVVLLDELDPYIRVRREQRQRHEFIETCRSLFQEYRRNIRFIMAGFIELWRHLRGEGDYSGTQNPYSNFLEDTGPLPALPTIEAQQIVKEGFQDVLGFRFASPRIPLMIVEATAGHPAFVQNFCAHLYERIHNRQSDEIRLEDVDATRGDDAYVQFVVETLDLNLNKLSQILVYLLAIQDSNQFSANDIFTLARSYGLETILREEVVESCKELQITSVFVFDSKLGVYRFVVPTYPAILRQLEVADRSHIDKLISEYQKGKSK